MDALQFDFHVHAGSELWGTPREDFIAALEALDIQLAGLLDHAEFYYETPPTWIANSVKRQKESGISVKEQSESGLRDFCQELQAFRAAGAHDFLIGLEFANVGLLPESFLEHPEYVSNCFGIPADGGAERGRLAAEGIRRFGDKIRASGKPGIVNHAFRSLVRRAWDAAKAGEPVANESVIAPDDIRRVCDATMEAGVFLEFNTGTIRMFEDSQEALDFMVYLFSLVEELGPNMSVGSDSHQPTPPLSHGIRYVLEQAPLSDARFAVLVERLKGLAPLTDGRATCQRSQTPLIS